MKGDINDMGNAIFAGALPCVLSVKYHKPPMQPKPKANPLLDSPNKSAIRIVKIIKNEPVAPACKPYLTGYLPSQSQEILETRYDTNITGNEKVINEEIE